MKTSKYIPVMSTEYKKWYIIPSAPIELLANKDGYILNTITGNMTRGSWVGHYLRYRWHAVNYYMQRLICLAFHGIPLGTNMVANHIDGNKRNNKPSNLEWITQQANVMHGYNTGLYKNKGINKSMEDLNSTNSELIGLFEYSLYMHPLSISEIIGRDLIQFKDYSYTVLKHHKQAYAPLYDIQVLSTSELAVLAEARLAHTHGRHVPGIVYYLHPDEIVAVEEFKNGKYKIIENKFTENKEKLGVIDDNSSPELSGKNIYIDRNYINLLSQAARYHSDYFYDDVMSSFDHSDFKILSDDYLI